MLNLLPFQQELERVHLSSATYSGSLLANSCLSLFGTQSGISIREKKASYRTSSLRLHLGKYQASSNTIRPKAGAPASFVYGPCYWMLSGYDRQTFMFSDEIFSQGRAELVTATVADFWASIKAYPYAPIQSLVDCVTLSLDSYISSGVQKESASFCPTSRPLSFYLHGAAGTGKTTFVAAFSAALQSCLRSRLDPEREVKVVKLPLNSTTAGQLKSILMVQVIAQRISSRV
jgi:hypothetical protein